MNNSRKRAFTLVELLVVVAIVTLLMSLLLPALSKAKSTAKRVSCLSSLHQLGISYQSYWSDNADWIPFAYYRNTQPGAVDSGVEFYWWNLMAKDMGDGSPQDVSPVARNKLMNGCPADPVTAPYWFGGVWKYSYGQSDYYWREGANSNISNPCGPSLLPWYPCGIYNANDSGVGWWQSSLKPWRLKMITFQSARTLAGDSSGTVLEPYINYSWAPPGNLSYSAAADPLKHDGKANYLMFDGHGESLDPITAEKALIDPGSLH